MFRLEYYYFLTMGIQIAKIFLSGIKIVMKICNCKYIPLKRNLPKPLPDHLIYHQATGIHQVTMEPVYRFVMLSTKKGEEKVFTNLEVMKSVVDRDGMKNVPSIYVKKLYSPYSGLGLGTSCLNFVRAYSKQHGCNGYFHLLSSCADSPNRIPHIFYRKYGMNSEFASINHRLDKFIAKSKTANYRDFRSVEMFYPPIKKPITRWQIFKNILGFGD